MAVVTVTAWSRGDGYLTVETTEWIAERAEPAPRLTDDLRGWLDANGYLYATGELIAQWCKERTGADPVGLYGVLPVNLRYGSRLPPR